MSLPFGQSVIHLPWALPVLVALVLLVCCIASVRRPPADEWIDERCGYGSVVDRWIEGG